MKDVDITQSDPATKVGTYSRCLAAEVPHGLNGQLWNAQAAHQTMREKPSADFGVPAPASYMHDLKMSRGEMRDRRRRVCRPGTEVQVKRARLHMSFECYFKKGSVSVTLQG
jgi:hypothetical protein